jgi:hypothetical protein
LLSDDKYVVRKTVSGSVALLKEDVKSMKKIEGSVMIPAQNLGLTSQDIRDISELLKRYKYDRKRKKESF